MYFFQQNILAPLLLTQPTHIHTSAHVNSHSNTQYPPTPPSFCCNQSFIALQDTTVSQRRLLHCCLLGDKDSSSFLQNISNDQMIKYNKISDDEKHY
jgi:hypothetical protein